ncbi:contactin-associated protein-like 4 [Chelmon rostratus]|uniref:contactin-associated protein-like 4 n=1 Tax=Chelmon rostratus TaxID=109905 RepID=UPI001BE523BA|nr:contactin-associated protein-like 4 [Chelmon rostratus]
MKTCSCRQKRTRQLNKTSFLCLVRSNEEQPTCSPPSRAGKCLSEETRCCLNHLTGSLQAFHTILTLGFEEISLGAGEERLAVSLLQQPPGFSAASRRFIMGLWTKRVAGIIAQVALLLCSSYGTTGEEVCDSALVSNLPPSSFRSSSQLSSSHAPGFAKLNRREGAGGWSPLTSDRYQWLEVDLGERTKITAVATQGRYGSSDWLTSYLLMFSDTGHNWKQYRQEDSIGSFPGNSNADSVVQYKLQQPAIHRFLRLIPLDWNPSGRIGLRLETYGCPYTSDVVSLDGSSSLVYRLSPGLRRTSGDVVSLKFKTLRNSGTLLHAEGEGGLSLSLELERGKLQLLLRQDRTSSSEPRRLASLGSLLDDQHWHHLAVERRSSHLNLTVDKHTERVQIPAEFSRWDIEQLSVGGVQDLSSPDTKRGFHGCLENLLYNGLNLIELAKHNDHQVTVVGNVTFSCAEPVSVAVTFPGPQSFLQLPGATASSLGGTSVGFQFRTWNKAGLLLTFALPREGGVVWLYLSEARLRLQIHKAGRALLELGAGSALNDGQWHSVELNSRWGRLTVAVDEEEGGVTHASFSITAGSQLFFGGCPAEEDSQECKNPFNIFQGCMRLLSLENQPVDLIKVQQRLLGNYSHLQIDMCGILDRCSPSRCEHGGRCSQSWTVFHCNCSDSGYSGATCHSSVYEQSCEAYKHNGNTSGHFYIDVDGSGPIKPQLVYCNMTEETTWMVIQHNNTEFTRLRASPGGNQHSVHFDYFTEEEQLLAAISQSEHCEQELSYHCRKSRLLNTPEGSPFSWWLGGPGPGRVQAYWGGAQPGSQQCACGLQGDCVDPQHYCNCDADRMEWAEDSGLLTHKESLPIRSLVLGDLQRPESEAAYRVGPLRCHGDKNFWNAAFFDKETSYLHFPTFHGELSADISFLFKTTASSGVFLENLGIKDFIRIELSSSTQVVFSFDVGNGPLEVRVESSVPLNDNRWHRVRAERNVKEASLRLDELPAATQEAPADGHFHLQLNSQLFIGGTASRQKGFQGCIRSLQLNGVTLDLEERARITPGVRPGCPGHCSSYGSFCQNQGRCVERASGFHCDCSLSAYTGVFCHTEVSASFKSETSVSYTFKAPFQLRRNSSVLPSSTYSEVISLSFRTNQSPAVLFYVSSYDREYLALLINKHDKLEVRYKLDSSRDAEVLRSRVRSLANGQLHTVTIRRLTDSVSVQIDQNAREEFNLTSEGEFSAVKSLVLGRLHESDDLDPDLARLASLGFTGCLSVVHFNSISPLKAALLHPDTSPVVITGPLLQSNCGSSASANPYAAENTHHLSDQTGSVGSGQPLVNAIRTDSALIGGVIAVVIFVVVTGLAITARFLYRRKETYRNQEVKGVKQEDSQDFPFNNQADSQNASGENPKEYFI